MDEAEPRLSSYGALARRCLNHSEWPSDVQPKPRSLASLFSKFDRGIEVEWLADRPAVQRVLNHVLGCSLTQVQAKLDALLGQADEKFSRWRLRDVPIARPLDLSAEQLPPGLPALPLKPQLWRRVWWRCSDGDGASLVRAWLAARGAADTTLVEEATDELISANSDLGDAPLFVEARTNLSAANLESCEAICVASLSPPPAGWTLVESPPVGDYLQPLLRWIAERLPQDGHFDADEALEWFRKSRPAGSGDCLETILGLAGLLDEIGIAKVQGRPLHRLAEDFAERRLTEASLAGSAEAQWLKKFGFEVLVGMARRALTESWNPWESPRTLEEWMPLVPTEFQRSVDVEWASVSLSRAGATVTANELEQALAEIPPGAFRVVKALRTARLLEPDDHGKLQIAPRWLAIAVRESAERAVLDDSPFEWGEALLRPHGARAVATRLKERAQKSGPELLERLLELEDDRQNPAFVMAMETLLQALGQATLLGAELGAEPVAALLELQSTALLRMGDQLTPRLLCSATDQPALGSWFLSLWALSEQLEATTASNLPGEVNPWATDVDLNAALDAVAACLKAARPMPWVLEAFALISRLGKTFDQLDHPLLVPARLTPKDKFDRWRAVVSVPHGVSAAEHLSDDWPTLAAAAWNGWQQADFPETTLFDHGSNHHRGAASLWPYLPGPVLDELLHRRHALVEQLPLSHLSESSWKSLLAWHYPLKAPASNDGDMPDFTPLPVSDLGQLPESLLEVVAIGAATHRDLPALQRLWSLQPALLKDVAVSSLDEALENSQGSATASGVFHTSPAEVAGELIALLQNKLSELGIETPLDEIARPWLHHQVVERTPFWREAYALLAEFEQRLSRAHQARADHAG